MVDIFKSQKRSIAKFYAEGAIFGLLAAVGVWLVLYSLFWLERFGGRVSVLSEEAVHIDQLPFTFELFKLISCFVPAAAVSRLVVAVFWDNGGPHEVAEIGVF